MSRTIRNWLLLLLIAGGVIAADQLSKYAVINSMEVGDSVAPIPALSEFFRITRSENTGAAFGFLAQASDLFLIIAVIVVAAMLYYYPRMPQDALLSRVSVAMVVGGALGNALDRIQHGLVVDFIHYRIPGIISNVSNLADHAIVLGVILLFIESWRQEKRRKREATLTQNAVPDSHEETELG